VAVETCSILTTSPNAVTSAVHDRMPVILDPDSYDLWLDPEMGDVSAVSELLKPYNARLMRCYPVSVDCEHRLHATCYLVERQSCITVGIRARS
jgi:putative SOS response-associated peptidase YedK